jgi:hypothetical protein
VLERSLFVLILVPGVALAQGNGPTNDRVRWSEGVDVRTGGEMRVRWDRETGTPASLSFEGARALQGNTPVEAARALLSGELGPLFEEGVVVCDETFAPGTGPLLVLSRVRELGNGRVRVDFTQRSGGVEVLDAGVSVELAQSATGFVPMSVRSRYCANVPVEMAVTAPLPLEAEMAERFPSVQVGELTVEPTCVRRIVPVGDGYRLACVVDTPVAPSNQTWRIALDAESGAELWRTKLSCSATTKGLAYEKNPGQTNRADVPLTGLYVFGGNNRVTTDAKGDHVLTGMVSLQEGLSGPLLRVFVSEEEELTYTGPANIQLSPQETASEQDELAAWHNILDFNAHLGNTYPRFKGSQALSKRFALVVRYKQNGRAVQNAFFSPGRATAGGDTFNDGYIAMGTFGGREAARSSSVCQHEYCHALFDSVVQLTGSLQAGGLNEGLADYLPSAFKNDPKIGDWLTNGSIRDLRQDYVWPQDDNGDVHRVGHIFAGALWDARQAADNNTRGDAAKIDQAVVEGIFRLRDRPSLMDAREAILDGDGAANAGAFRVTLTRAFSEHGIGPAPNNDTPTLDAIARQTARVGETLSVSLTTDDPDGDPVTISASPLDNGAVVNGSYEFTPDASQLGLQQVTLTASDEELSTSVTFEIDVQPAPVVQSGVAPVGSRASTAAASTSGKRSGGGGGGGCSLGGAADAPVGGGWIMLIVFGFLWRARKP